MFKKIINYVLLLSVVFYLYFLYKIIIFDLQTDITKLAKLKLNSAYVALFMAVVAFIRSHLK
ncbi:hypothetical protein ACP8HI_09855 [Paenibacillus sp. FA6]|uniref:hypothetical protein n=1 Tax=Paenibacillus sp. FA6 TaxID=3413029 RepID=UPI003F65C08E